MGRFLVSLPIWVSGAILILGIPALMVVALLLIRRAFPALRTTGHNDVAAGLMTLVGVIYAVVAGFTTIDQLGNYTEVRDDVRQQAFDLAVLATGSRTMGPAAHREIQDAVIAYNRAVIDEWPRLTRGMSSPRVEREHRRLLGSVADLRPVTDPQRAFVDDGTARLMQAGVDRLHLLYDARHGHLEGAVWASLLMASAVTLLFCLLFGIENARLAYLMVAGVGAIIAINLFLMVQLNYPLAGDLSVPPESFRQVVAELTR
ncbi:MAG: hypothetical protein ACRDPK_19865 [Carbonactinosporaceae bacterium]